MGSLEEIGALLGFAAFAGLAVLVFLTFQQARHIRRLRDWAGRAPERAAAELARVEGEAEDKTLAAPEGLAATGADHPRGEGLRDRMADLREGFADRWAELDRRSPVSPRIILGGLAAVIAGVAIATSGFGLFGGEDSADGAGEKKAEKSEKSGGSGGDEDKLVVAVLNGTAPEGGTGVAGIADRVGNDVEAEGYELGAVDDAGSFEASVVMYLPGEDEAAVEVADSMEGVLGPTETAEMTPEIEAIADGASIALIVGQDDAGI
jgi:hypothetical protein